jgi:hypothetical protein
MNSVKEQIICIKFCSIVKKADAETCKCYMKLTVVMPQVIGHPMNGSDILKMEELQWMTVSSVAELQLQDQNL